MTANNDGIRHLNEKLETLLKRQVDFSVEIDQLRKEINLLRKPQRTTQVVENRETEADQPLVPGGKEADKEVITPIGQRYIAPRSAVVTGVSSPSKQRPPNVKSDLEKFIGENLINKIGIAITVIGVAIGAKYSIEHQLISPLTRIILGYLMGLGLLGVGIKLKQNYENYSAVLVSGAMAIMYFITYAGYSFYDLFPQSVAFGLMVIFTAFTVVAAIRFNNVVIAHIGLVGAYAVPFLLSEDSGRVEILFSYMAIINIGVLMIAFLKYWKSLYYSSFIVTWLIFFSWFNNNYQQSEHFGLSLIFLSIFFLTFYIVFLAYKLRKNEKFDTDDILLLLANSFIFYFIGYAVFESHQAGENLLGLFTFGNAVIHFVISIVIYRQMLVDRNLFYLIAGLVLIFITIAIPVQWDGNWVTLLWTLEAALLFWIGRTKGVPDYEKLSYPLMFLAFFSIIHDWLTIYTSYNPELPDTRIALFLNINFLTSLFFIGSFGFINYLNSNKKYSPARFAQNSINSLVSFSVPAILFIALYYSFRVEISTWWNQLYIDSTHSVNPESLQRNSDRGNEDLMMFKIIWIINYSLLFFSIASFINNRKLRSDELGFINIGLGTYAILAFLTVGLYHLSELRESYIRLVDSGVGGHFYSIGIRYVSFALIGLMFISIYDSIRQDFLTRYPINFNIAFDLLLYISVLWIASSELITWLDIMKFSESDKLGLSILWGVYALILIGVGIWQRKKHLRVGAILLFTVTLIKLFFYDISHLDTVAKTIVFVSLGVLLLIISFLYNKYKILIAE